MHLARHRADQLLPAGHRSRLRRFQCGTHRVFQGAGTRSAARVHRHPGASVPHRTADRDRSYRHVPHRQGLLQQGVVVMRKGSLLVAVSILAAFAAPNLAGQNMGKDTVSGGHVCECGAHPPGPPRDREVTPYAGEPADMRPYAKFAAPYDTNYTRPNIYVGAARDIPEPKDLTEVRIGFFGPIEHNSESILGLRMLHGAQLAVEEANTRGGYGGKPFKLMLHNDYNNWQAKAVYGDVRPTEPAIWGSASDETVKMAYDEKVWAIFGSISAESTHIALRVALRAELPVVNSASTDPTIPETYIPWYFTNL